MSGWSNPDVTPAHPPAGGASSAPPPGPPGPFGAGGTPVAPHASGRVDPFGAAPTRRKRGAIRIAVGAALAVVGLVGSVVGILDAVEAAGDVRGEAVSEGTVSAGFSEPFAFEAPPGGGDYTLWLVFPGSVAQEPDQELAIRDTVCEVDRADGSQAVIRGARQAVSTTLGQSSTIGWFSAPEGRVEIQCQYAAGTRQSVARRPAQVPVVASPGRPTVLGDGILLIVGGVGAVIAGVAILAWGLRGSRVPV